MGLISATIAPFVAGYEMHMISPISFIKNPLLWVELMSKHKVTWSIAPDFGYRLVARKFLDVKKSAKSGNMCPILGLDLSSIVRLYSGAEPIRHDTIQQFQDAFGEYGLPTDWFGATYGLAENVVYVCSLGQLTLSVYQPSGQSLVSVGRLDDYVPHGQTMKVVCPYTMREMSNGEVGELWISCQSNASGYFGQPELSTNAFRATLPNEDDKKFYLRTGDLVFVEDGFLYICGRHKDLVIVNGVNYYPQDIEYAVQEASQAVRPGCVAAFSSDVDGGGDPDLEVVFEIRNTYAKATDAAEVVDIVYSAIIQDVGLVPARVVAIKERSIPKTTSGKIQRNATRSALHNGSLKVLHEYKSGQRSTNSVVPYQHQKGAKKQSREYHILVSILLDLC